MVAALAIGCGSKKEGGSEKNEGTTEKTKYEQNACLPCVAAIITCCIMGDMIY